MRTVLALVCFFAGLSAGFWIDDAMLARHGTSVKQILSSENR